MRNFLFSILLSIPSVLMAGVDDGMLAHYDFQSTNAKSVEDASGQGHTATLVSKATVEDCGTFRVLRLGDGKGYLNMGSKLGADFAKCDNYTVSMYYRVDETAPLDGAGRFLWSFATSSATTQTEGMYSGYRLNYQHIGSSPTGWGCERGFEIGGEARKGQWTHVLYVQAGTSGKLYLDGVLRGSSTEMYLNTECCAAKAPNCNWIGRAAFTTDQYLTRTSVADIRIYGRAVGNDEIATLAEVRHQLTYQYEHGSEGDRTALNKAIAEAEALLGGDISHYPSGAVEDYRDVLVMAQDANKAVQMSQPFIDAQQERLNAARTVFEASKGFEWNLEKMLETYDTNRGFRHPGGLHTEADFARVRAQLKAGNKRVTDAWNILLNSEYSQANVATWPTETIWRSGSGDNYLNVARGAHMAYQNALRWKIAGTRANADGAVRILTAWARGNKYVSGNTNLSLASGIYGYELCQAAELMRDYEGWPREEFEEFKQYILRVWYPCCIDFMRRRHDTWANYANAATAGWDGRPGHYWSNWGLCNDLALITMGILLDDVYIYNQGLSFYKHDQVGTFNPNRTGDVINDGLTEFIGNLVPAVNKDKRGPLGYIGQMQESGRDQGHAMMALGLAVDICQTLWSQGDDAYSMMDNRLAAGIEGVAGYNFAGLEDLPWTNYGYADCRTARHNAWWHTYHSGSGRGHMRSYWGRVIGHFEGVKGIKMQYSELGLLYMGIDDGGWGGSSGDYDHLGYSVLMETRDQQLATQIPTWLTGQMTVNGTVLKQNELGGLKNTYIVDNNTGVVPGTIITLQPQLPQGAEDTGLWKWETGETTREITIVADASRVYRVTYTNAEGLASEQVFTIAVQGDCVPSEAYSGAWIDGQPVDGTEIEAFYGQTVSLNINGSGGYGSVIWDNGSTDATRNIIALRDRTVSGAYVNQGGRHTPVVFHIKVRSLQPMVVVNGVEMPDVFDLIVKPGDNVAIAPRVASSLTDVQYEWSDGSTGSAIMIDSITTSCTYSLHFTSAEQQMEATWRILVAEEGDRDVEDGYHKIRLVGSERYLTNRGEGKQVYFDEASDDKRQVWKIERKTNSGKINIQSVVDDMSLSAAGTLGTAKLSPFKMQGAAGTNLMSIRAAASGNYLDVDEQGQLTRATTEFNGYMFELIPVEIDETAISTPHAKCLHDGKRYTLNGTEAPVDYKGIVILNGKKVIQ